MIQNISTETIAELHGYIERDVSAGFLNSVEIVESAVSALEDEADPATLRKEAERFTQIALAAHAADQATWTGLTDCDRLDMAFHELNEQGIVSRQNFSCCGSCGAGEIFDEMSTAESQGQAVHGYIFYHAQDTESAAEGEGLCLNYGSTQEDEQSALGVANKAIEVLAKYGLKTEWDGTWNKRVAVTLDWRRRRNHGGAV